MMPSPRWRAILAAFSLLVLGGVIGVTLDRVWLTRAGETAHPPIDARMEMIEALQAELSLTPAQANEVGAILERYQEQVTHTWETVRPNLRAAMDSVGSEIEAVLAPEQRERFRTWISEQHGPNGSMGRDRGRP